MKEGAGDDLLAGIGSNDDEQSDDQGEQTASTRAEPTQDPEPQRSTSDDIPYLLRRNRVKEERETIGFGLQKGTREREGDVLREVKAELDVEQLPLTDLREAAYLAGLDETERIKQILLDWGYEHRR